MIRFHFCAGLIALAMLLVTPLLTRGQDFRPGYIVTLKGDSVRGHVRYASSASSAKQCLFRASARDQKQRYLPGEIAGFGIDGDRAFESVVVHGDSNPKHFARVLSTGNIDLLRVRKQFLLRKDSLVILPPEVELRVAVANGEAIRKDRPYAAILNMAMADCGRPVDDIQYTEKELTQVVDDYNSCKNPAYRSIQKRPIARVGFNAFVSYTYSDLFLKYDNAVMEPSTFASVGLGADLSSPRINDKLFLSLDASYARSLYQGLIRRPLWRLSSPRRRLHALHHPASRRRIPVQFPARLTDPLCECRIHPVCRSR